MPFESIAVVHDFLYCYSGAERVLEHILRVFPKADLFALFDFVPEGQRGFLQGKHVHSSFLQSLPLIRSHHRAYLPLMPIAVEQLDVTDYDLVISSSYLAAKGVITRPDQLHICYCHTPVRYAWDLQHEYLCHAGLAQGVRSWLARCLLHYVRNWDVRSSNGVDLFVANSQFIARRIRRAYRRAARVIHPPVDTEAFVLGKVREGFYLTASRMVAYKRMDLIVEAFSATPSRRLVVIGDGPELKRIRRGAGPNVSFLGHVSDASLRSYMQRARAFVFAAQEDFGIVAVEAMACGTPVIAFGRGGINDSVSDGMNGILFAKQDLSSLNAAIDRFETYGVAWQAHEIRSSVMRFSAQRFESEFARYVSDAWTVSTHAPGQRQEAGAQVSDAESLEDRISRASPDRKEVSLAFAAPA